MTDEGYRAMTEFFRHARRHLFTRDGWKVEYLTFLVT